MESAETAFTTFFNIFNQIYDKYFPIKIKNVTKKSLRKPWVTYTMSEKIKRKHYLARLAKTGMIDQNTYSDFRNNLTKELREAKSMYYTTEFSKNKGDIRGTWKIINNNIKKEVKSHKVVIKDNDNIVNQEDIPCKFLNYFISIPLQLISKINPVDVNASSFLTKRSRNSFFMSPVINKDIEMAINDLKSSNGIHTISTVVLKDVASVISEPLSHILNLCIKQGYFPVELKTG